MPDDFVKVAAVSEVSPGDMKVVDVGDDQILLVNVDGEVHACDDICSHAYASLSEGDLDGAEVQCPLHGAIFNVRTGKVLTPPAVDSAARLSRCGWRATISWWGRPREGEE